MVVNSLCRKEPTALNTFKIPQEFIRNLVDEIKPDI